MPTKSFRAAAVQTLARLGDLDYNIENARMHILDAVRQGADLVVLPECMNTGYLFDSADHARTLAESVDGRFVSALGRMAREFSIYIASGMTEKDDAAGKLFNSGVLLDRTGKRICHYHKQFLATHDQNWFAVGARGCPVVDTELGSIGMLICFDGRIPEIARCLALQGAEVLLDMANFFAMDQAEMWVPARAYENGVWIVAATKAGYERSIYYPGGSMIADPTGRVAARMPYDAHGVVVAEVAPAAARDKRIYAGGDKFKDRRPDTYAILNRPFSETPAASFGEQPIVPSRATAKCAAVQAHATPDGGLSSAVALAKHTALLGANLIVLPEYVEWPSWYVDADAADALASQSKETLASFAAVCRDHKCCAVVSTVERDGSDLYPTAVLLGTKGEVVGRYRKVHLTPEERSWATPGSDLPVFETPFGRVGVMLGYDAVFPETSRCLALKGADVILWPASLREAFERQLLAVPRAADNRCAVVLANRYDAPSAGGSVYIPPAGFPLWNIDSVAPPDARPDIIRVGFLDLAASRQKQMIPKVHMLANRVVSTYGPLVG